MATRGEILPQQVWDSTNGIDLLRGWQRGTLPRSPLSNLIGAQVLQVGEGEITCAIPASAWFCGIGGTLYGGVLALLADYAIHGAVQSVLSPGTAWATLDLKVRFLRPIITDGHGASARPGHLATGSRSLRSRSALPGRSPRSPTPPLCCFLTGPGRDSSN